MNFCHTKAMRYLLMKVYEILRWIALKFECRLSPDPVIIQYHMNYFAVTAPRMRIWN